MAYKDPAKEKKYQQDWREKNKEKEQPKRKERYEKNKEKEQAKARERYQENKEQIDEYNEKYKANRNQHAYDSIMSDKIIDPKKWDMWCNNIKSTAAKNSRPYSDDFTSDVMFEMVVQGCFYCGDMATTIDRINSKLEHTPDNCVGSCWGCNKSKGTADHNTFIRKAYYRARKTYYDDDTNIWVTHKNKPRMSDYKRKGVPFDLTKDEWDKLVVGKCKYCHRSPIAWFGVDRIVPSLGYVSDNVDSCCWDCNNDKAKDNVDTMHKRNKRIAQRMDDGELVIGGHKKVILHNGTHPSSKTICANGKMYESISAAADAIKMKQSTFRRRISDGKDPCIFAVTKEFYDFAIENNLENITNNMFVAFDYYVNN